MVGPTTRATISCFRIGKSSGRGASDLREACGKLVVRPDPARVALAAAIAAASEADKALAQAKGVLERAETFVSEAQSRVDQASAAVSHAVNEQGAALAEAFAGNNQGPPAMGAATRAARMRMADCEDELDASRSTLDKLRDAVREREDAVGEARRAVDEAIAGVVAAHAEALLGQRKPRSTNMSSGARCCTSFSVRSTLERRTQGRGQLPGGSSLCRQPSSGRGKVRRGGRVARGRRRVGA